MGHIILNSKLVEITVTRRITKIHAASLFLPHCIFFLGNWIFYFIFYFIFILFLSASLIVLLIIARKDAIKTYFDANIINKNRTYIPIKRNHKRRLENWNRKIQRDKMKKIKISINKRMKTVKPSEWVQILAAAEVKQLKNLNLRILIHTCI